MEESLLLLSSSSCHVICTVVPSPHSLSAASSQRPLETTAPSCRCSTGTAASRWTDRTPSVTRNWNTNPSTWWVDVSISSSQSHGKAGNFTGATAITGFFYSIVFNIQDHLIWIYICGSVGWQLHPSSLIGRRERTWRWLIRWCHWVPWKRWGGSRWRRRSIGLEATRAGRTLFSSGSTRFLSLEPELEPNTDGVLMAFKWHGLLLHVCRWIRSWGKDVTLRRIRKQTLVLTCNQFRPLWVNAAHILSFYPLTLPQRLNLIITQTFQHFFTFSVNIILYGFFYKTFSQKVKIYWCFSLCGDIWSSHCDEYSTHTHTHLY